MGNVSLDFRGPRATVCQTQFGHTALTCAAHVGHAECLRVLLDAGANKEAKTKVCFREEFSLKCECL